MRSRCPAESASHPASCREIDFARTEEDRRLLLRILVNRCVAVDDRASSGSIRRLINLKARSGSYPAACRHMSNRETALNGDQDVGAHTLCMGTELAGRVYRSGLRSWSGGF